MALVTFLSDFGYQDHYVGAVKATILSMNPALRIVDICHGVPSCNIAHASFVLRALYGKFPTGTVHLVAVGSDTADGALPVALQQEGHFFVGADNGLFSLISEQNPTVVVDLSALPKASNTFVTKNKCAAAVAMLASGKSIYDLGKPSELQTLRSKQGSTSDKGMQGHVIYVDATGNLITNLYKKDFLRCMKQAKVDSFEIVVGRERSQQLHTAYDDVAGGECFFLFNDLDLLEIGVRYGSAEKLLKMGYDTAAYIQFK